MKAKHKVSKDMDEVEHMKVDLKMPMPQMQHDEDMKRKMKKHKKGKM